MINVLEFGATPGSEQLCTEAFQAAIDAAGKRTVQVPPGIYRIGTINLKQASLYLECGATLVGSDKIEDYRWNGYQHNEMKQVLSLIYSLESDDIRIFGEGCIDLSGDHFFDLDRPVLPETAIPLTDEQRAECTRAYTKRPNQPIFFYRCRHVTVEGIRIINAPCWTLTFVECEDVRLLDLTIDNNPVLPNNDGMHFCGCRGVLVSGCHISAGDDCIALSGITDWDIPCEEVVISDCILRSRSKAIVVGYMHSLVRHVCIQNVIIRESNRGICIMTSSRTGQVEDVQISNVSVDTRIYAGNWWGNGEAICLMAVYHHLDAYTLPAPDRRIAVNIRDVSISNIRCSSENALAIIGEDSNIENIHISQLTFALKPSRNKGVKGNRIDLSPSAADCELPDDQPCWLVIREARQIRISGYTIRPFQGSQPVIIRQSVSDFRLEP